MDFSAIMGNALLIVIIIGVILLQFFLRRRHKPAATHRETALSLLSELRLNLSLAEVFRRDWRVRKFETVNWQMNKTKLDFLAQPVRAALTDAYVMAEDFNQQIAAAKKYKSVSYMGNIDVNRLKEPLAMSKQGLEKWLLANGGVKESPPKYPGLFDGWLGRW